MKTLAEIYSQYRGDDWISGTDKGSTHSYIDVYDLLLLPYRCKPGVRMLEIGISEASVLMWTEYFSLGEVQGIDLPENWKTPSKVGFPQVLLMDATKPDHNLLIEVKARKFNVIIEDAGHSIEQQLALYLVWKWWLNPGGVYVIEDIQDIDKSRDQLERIDPSKKVTIYDRRQVKGRFDDVLVVITDPY